MKYKRILALAGALVMAGLYVAALVAALSGSPSSKNFLMAALFCTVAVPVIVYAFQLILHVTRREAVDEGGEPGGEKPYEPETDAGGRGVKQTGEAETTAKTTDTKQTR